MWSVGGFPCDADKFARFVIVKPVVIRKTAHGYKIVYIVQIDCD